MKYFEARAEASIEQLTYAAWRVAEFTRAKKFPKLKKVLADLRKGRNKHAQTMAQQIAIARMWASLGYGKIKSIHDKK